MPARRRAAATILASAAAAALGGCSAPVATEAAPSASDPVCAELLMALPTELAGAQQRSTTSQSSRAWGDPAIALRCGVDPPGPTTDRCINVTDAAGGEVDWVVSELDDPDVAQDSWRFTTYGREPTVEVSVPAQYAGEDGTDVLVDLTGAITQIPVQRSCV